MRAVQKNARMNKMLIAGALLVVLGLAGYLAYRALRPGPASGNQTTNVSIQLNWVPNAQFSGLYVAAAKGFYRTEGLNVTIRPYRDGLDEGKDLASGNATYSIYSPVELVSDLDKGHAFKAVAATYQTSPFAMVSLKSSHILTPKDFVGKVLGAKGGNLNARLTFPTLAQAYGVSANSYMLKDLDFSVDEGDDIVQRRADMVDLYRTDQVYFLDQRKISYNILYPEDYGFRTYGDLIVTTNTQIQAHPDQVRRFIRATQEGWAYALAHQSEALRIVAAKEDKLYRDAPHEAYILSHSAPLIEPVGGNPIGSMGVIPWNNVINAMKAGGSLKRDIDPSTAYTVQFLRD